MLACILLLGFMNLVWGVSPITFQSYSPWLDEKCVYIRSAIRSVPLDDGEPVCAAFCAARSQFCRGYHINEDNHTCDLFKIEDQVACSPAIQSLDTTLNIQTNKPITKLGIYIGLAESGIAHPFLNDGFPTFSIPEAQDWLEMTIEYKNGILGCNGGKQCWFWKFGTNEWSDFAAPQSFHYQGRLVLLEGKPLIIGGCNVPQAGGINQKKVEVYEETIGQWLFKLDMPQATKNFAAVVVNNGTKVFVMGGIISATAITKKVYSYDLTTDFWEDLNRPMTVALGGPLSTVVTLPDSRVGVLVVGGLELGFNVHSLSYFMDLTTLTWETLSSFKTTDIKVYNGNMVQIGENLYIIPIYQDELRRPAKTVLIRNMSTMNNSWVKYDVSPRFDLGPKTQIPLTVQEHTMTWHSN